MINLTSRIQLTELVWTLVAFVGAYFAYLNLKESVRDRKAIKRAAESSRRGVGHAYDTLKVWAVFSVSLHRTLIAIELIFAAVGVIAMARRPSPDVETAASIILVVLLVGASATLSLLSYRWRQVDTVIKSISDETEKVVEKQVIREEKQNIRKGKQDDRGDEQDEREVEQNVREVDQNVRDKEIP